MQLAKRKYLVMLVFNLECTSSNLKWIVPKFAKTHGLIHLILDSLCASFLDSTVNKGHFKNISIFRTAFFWILRGLSGDSMTALAMKSTWPLFEPLVLNRVCIVVGSKQQ